MPSPPPVLARYRDRIERALDECLPSPGQAPARLHAAMRYAALGAGKRLRAMLVHAAGAALGAPAGALDVPACAVELIHAYSLVHDDLPAMDDDDLRRGRPSCHRAFDEATAILAGDALQARAFELLAADPRLTVTPRRRIEMVTCLAQAAGSQGLAGGQAIDLAAVGRSLELAELEDMHARKTGALIGAAVMLGALTREPLDPAEREALARYARALGVAFQIADDVLDVTGDQATLGKSPGADAARAKPTYPALLGVPAAQQLAREWCERALAALTPLGARGADLAAIARYSVERTH